MFVKIVFPLLFMFNLSLGTKAPDNIILPETFDAGLDKLMLNGTGIRSKYSIDLFTGGLYLKNKCSDAQRVVMGNEPMVIRLHVTSGLITGNKLEKAIRSEFARVTNGDIGIYQERIDRLAQVFKEDLKLNDVFDLVYTPQEGLKVYKNSTYKTTIEGLDFKQTIFKTWFGDDPADEKFKKGMLGLY